jgi:hypothetical protein
MNRASHINVMALPFDVEFGVAGFDCNRASKFLVSVVFHASLLCVATFCRIS